MDWEQELNETLKTLESEASKFELRPHVQDLGRVRRVGDGIAFVEGLSEAMINEVVVFSNGVRGEVLDLAEDVAGCVIYGPEEGILGGSPVFRTGATPTMPVGESILGRIVDPLGRPRDGLGPLNCSEVRVVEQEAPGPLERQPIYEPLFTGVKIIDAGVPIGLGQRELILGDRETGKTSIALDAIINQRESDIVCFYVSIGKKRSSVAEVLDVLREEKAMEHTVLVVADAADTASLRYLAPFAACTIAEWFAYRGRHALVVYDDLTRHAEAYRELSLMLRRPPGREAYPGDIFSVHARLLERSFKLNDQLGGGSITSLPIVETQRGNIAGYIPTNLISITDGQLFLDASLFAEGQLPAIDLGRSVSRVGGDAQPATMREAAANLRLEMGQYEEVKGFTRFGAILDESTRRQIARGERLVNLLAQDERLVLPLSAQIAEFWALKQGLLDDLSADAMSEFEQKLLDHSSDYAYLDAQLRTEQEIDADSAGDLEEWIEKAKAGLV